MTQVFLIKLHVQYPTGNAYGDIEFIVSNTNSRAALVALLNSHKFPQVDVLKVQIEHYHGQLIIEQNIGEM
jgi:hypothetical protein